MTTFKKGDDVPDWVLRFNPATMISMKFGVDAFVEITDSIVHVYPLEKPEWPEATIMVRTKENWEKDKMVWPTAQHHRVNIYGTPKAMQSTDIRARDAAYVKPIMRDCIEKCGRTFRIIDECEFRCDTCKEKIRKMQLRVEAGNALLDANKAIA